MATINTANLTPMQLARTNAALDKLYRYSDGIRPLRAEIERGAGVKEEWDGGADYNRRKFNAMNHAEQRAYEAKLKAKRQYTVDGTIVPKLVYDAVVGPTAKQHFTF
jgi:hypothetical protein